MKDLGKELKLFSAELSNLQQKGEITGFSLIGAMAVSAHARPRATKDVDFLVSADHDFFFKVFPGKLNKKGYAVKVFRGGLDDPVNGLIRIYDKASKDELVDIIPVFWKWQNEIVAGAERIEMFGVSIPIARIEDLIVLKLKAYGPQDILDVEELFKAAKISKKADTERLQNLAKRAGVNKSLVKIADKLGFKL